MIIEHIENYKEICPQCGRFIKVGRFSSELFDFIICRECMQALTDYVTQNKRKPIVYDKACKQWKGLDAYELEEWKEQFEVNSDKLVSELLKMVDWIEKNKGDKRVNKRDWRKFIMNWLRRAGNGKSKTNS